MKNNYKSLTDEIDDLYADKKFVQCLQKYYRLLSVINKTDEKYGNIAFRSYMRMANIYAALDQQSNALSSARKAIPFVVTSEDEILINWTFSYCYSKNDLNKAIEYINKSIEESAKIGDEETLYQALVHKAWLTSDEELMKDAVSHCESLGLNTRRLDALYVDMFEMYMDLNNLLKAEKTINKIKNKAYGECLRERIFQLANSAN
jgi:tetratricopeptide (TPR) repeat protein